MLEISLISESLGLHPVVADLFAAFAGEAQHGRWQLDPNWVQPLEARCGSADPAELFGIVEGLMRVAHAIERVDAPDGARTAAELRGEALRLTRRFAVFRGESAAMAQPVGDGPEQAKRLLGRPPSGSYATVPEHEARRSLSGLLGLVPLKP